MIAWGFFWAAVLSASSTGIRQIIYAGTPPYIGCTGEVFRRFRQACIASANKGTIKNGMRLETEKNVIILGDVNPGAVVISTGNVIILGCCMGSVSAGAGGDESCFIAAMTLLAREIKIASYINRSAITKRIDRGDYPVDPKIAYLRHGHIFYEPLRSTAFEHMDALSAGSGTEETQERNNT